MDEQKHTEPEEERDQEQEQKLSDLEVPEEQGDVVKGGLEPPDGIHHR